ncbi:MAG: hypothetical protein L0229_22805 [Blastocatellia bacterium]|nr:hypothetical protein [Blastocatellia bacterium]
MTVVRVGAVIVPARTIPLESFHDRYILARSQEGEQFILIDRKRADRDDFIV